jgi:hypothetical protein
MMHTLADISFSLPTLSLSSWVLVWVAAFCSGMSKAGLAGISMLGVTLMAMAMDGLASTGVVLPLLIFADVLAASTFRMHILWAEIQRLLPPIFVGLCLGWIYMIYLKEQRQLFRPVVGGMVLGMVVLQLVRQKTPSLDAALPQSRPFGLLIGLLVGFSTMVANAAGPIASLYLIILALPKQQMVHTTAWLFLIVNLAKVPFSVHLGLINGGSLALNLCQFPAVMVGLLCGKWLVGKLSQNLFQTLVLAFSVLSALYLIFDA